MSTMSNAQNQKALDIKLINKIKIHEGKREFVYQDHYGYWTIGYGRLVDKRKGGKLSEAEMEYLLANDLKQCEIELAHYQWYQIQDDVRKGVLIELSFNMGTPGLLTFKKMIAALGKLDFVTASKELLDSKWAKKDVGQSRVDDIKFRLEKGMYK